MLSILAYYGAFARKNRFFEISCYDIYSRGETRAAEVGGLTELRPSTSWYSNLKEPTVGTMRCIKTYIYIIKVPASIVLN